MPQDSRYPYDKDAARDLPSDEAEQPGPKGIGWAVKQLQNGQRVQRAGWNGKGMWLALVFDASFGMKNMPSNWAGYLSFVVMFTADHRLVPWLCSQTDLLATDWQIAP